MRQLILLVCVLLLTGCFGGGAEVPQDHFYRLTDIATAKQVKTNFNTVAVGALKSDDLYRERAILYSDVKQPLHIRRYHYHHWSQIPNALIQDHFIEYLRKAQFSPHVVRYGDVVNVDARITGYIKRFERLIDAGEVKIQARLELQLETLGSKRDYFQSTYDVVQSTSDTSMHATVTALSKALEAIYQQFINDLVKHDLVSMN